MLCSPWLKPPKTLVPMFWESVLAGVCTDQHNNTHPGAVCSPCCHLTKDREVSAALPPDYGAAAVRLLNSSSTLQNEVKISFQNPGGPLFRRRKKSLSYFGDSESHLYSTTRAHRPAPGSSTSICCPEKRNYLLDFCGKQRPAHFMDRNSQAKGFSF